MKRSPRHRWVLVTLEGDVLRTVALGDRDTLRAEREERVHVIGRKPGLQHPGEGVALYDTHGQLRDCYPSFPRTGDGTRVRWPERVPVDGARPEARTFQTRAVQP